MLNFLKSKERKQTDLIYEIMSAWHASCIASVNNKKSLKEPRVIVGTILFFIGSMDNLCKSADFDDSKFMTSTINILAALGYPKEVPGPIFMNFYNPENKQSTFALNANTEGGRGIGIFLNKKDPSACFTFSNLVKKWSEDPEMTGEDLYLFNMGLKK